MTLSAMSASMLALVGVLAALAPANGQTPVPGGITVTNYQCFDCLKDAAGNPRKVRALFIDSQSVVENSAARERALELGIDYSCNDPALALPECFVASNWNSGWVGALTKQIFDNLGVEVIALTQANFTLNSSAVYSGSSSYTRCVWEVRVGGADICVGDFWETNERRRIAPFTSSLDLDTMRLVSLKSGSAEFEPKSLLNIFDPLDDTVWAVTVCMFFFAAFLLWFVEQGVGCEDFEYEDSLSSQTYRQLQGACKSLWLTMLGFVSVAPAHQPTTWPGRLIVLGYAFMLYITAASYTANLATFLLIQNDPQPLVNSLADLGQRQTGLCMLEAMFPLVNETIVAEKDKIPFGWYGPMLEQLYRGRCQGAIIGKTEYQTHILGQAVSFTACVDPRDPFNHGSCQDPTIEPEFIDLACNAGCEGEPDKDRSECPLSCPHYRKYCDIIEVVDSKFDLAIGIGMPVINELQDYISAWIVPLKLDRTTSRLRSQYVDEAAPDVCTSAQSEAEPLDIEAMAGIFFLSGVVIFIGLLFHLVEMLVCRGKVAVEEPQGGAAAEEAAAGGGEAVAAKAAKGKAEQGGEEGGVPHDYQDEDKSAKKIIDALGAKIDVMMKRLEQLEQQEVPMGVPMNGVANGEEAVKRKPSAENGPNGSNGPQKDGLFGGLFGM